MRTIKPIGEQIIIRTLPPDRVGSIIIPDSARRITHQGEDPTAGSEELQYVNRWLFEDMTESMKRIASLCKYRQLNCYQVLISEEEKELLNDLVARAEKAILPKTETGILPSAGAGIHFVEAEVVAVGTGIRAKDPGLFDELVQGLESIFDPEDGNTKRCDPEHPKLSKLLARARNGHREPFLVKPGDRILYHPSVQKFDRQIPPEWMGLEPGEGDVFIIREESVLAVLDKEEEKQEQENQRSATRTTSAPCVSEVS